MPRRSRPFFALAVFAASLPCLAGCLGDESQALLSTFDREMVIVALIFAAFWVFALGAVVGSFLNVVAYRLPRGYSLSHPGSFCPACRTPIRWHDNLPVIGWLRLRGKCRACQAAISARYPIVEAALGATYLLLAVVELLSGGANIPFRPIDIRGYTGMELAARPQLIGYWAFHAWLMSLLVAWALISFDRRMVPRSLTIVGAMVALVASAIWPFLQAVPWLTTIDALGPRTWGDGLISAGVGLAAGGLAGILLGNGAAGILAVVGAHLGWQAALAIAAIAGSVRLPIRLAFVLIRRRPPAPPPVYISMCTLWHITLWRTLIEIAWWPGRYYSWPVGAGWWGAVALLGIVDRWLARSESGVAHDFEPPAEGWPWAV